MYASVFTVKGLSRIAIILVKARGLSRIGHIWIKAWGLSRIDIILIKPHGLSRIYRDSLGYTYTFSYVFYRSMHFLQDKKYIYRYIQLYCC